MTAPPERMEAVDPHRHGLEPFFDMVPFFVIEMTAQFLPSKGSQVAAAINEKLGFSDLVFLGQSV